MLKRRLQNADVIGYIPYVARITPREGLTLHPSDNRVEADRAIMRWSWQPPKRC